MRIEIRFEYIRDYLIQKEQKLRDRQMRMDDMIKKGEGGYMDLSNREDVNFIK